MKCRATMKPSAKAITPAMRVKTARAFTTVCFSPSEFSVRCGRARALVTCDIDRHPSCSLDRSVGVCPPVHTARSPRCSPSCHGETVTAPVQRRQDPPMRRYEMMIILDPGLEENTIQPSLDQFLTVVRDGGGSVDKVDVWGRRRLAYDIDKKSEGIYAVIDMNAEPDTVRELDRQLGLNEAVLRTKVLRPERH